MSTSSTSSKVGKRPRRHGPSWPSVCLSASFLCYLGLFGAQVLVHHRSVPNQRNASRGGPPVASRATHAGPGDRRSGGGPNAGRSAGGPPPAPDPPPPTGDRDSLSILMAAVRDVGRPIHDEAVNRTVESDRCARHGWTYSDRTDRRRIFAGSLLADDSWHSLGASALESYGVYHSVTFVESNRTQSFRPRKVRFGPGSDELRILTSGIFGPDTTVQVDSFVDEVQDRKRGKNNLVREHMQRELILRRWKALGMRDDDVGMIMDVDEIPSRDFLRAVQICDVRPWKASPSTCRSPMLRSATAFFEESPKCVHWEGLTPVSFRPWYSPSMVIGECIEGIGNSTRHPSAPRNYVDVDGVGHGGRHAGYGYQNDYSKIPNGDANGMFPLYNACDFRRMSSGQFMKGNTGFHLHNFFVSTDAVRFKHATYAHTHGGAHTDPLGAVNADLMMLVKCVMDRDGEGDRRRRVENGLELFGESFPLPAAFRLEGYVDARHEEVRALVAKDEEMYGRADNYTGHHLYNKDSMLTHPGRIHSNTVT